MAVSTPWPPVYDTFEVLSAGTPLPKDDKDMVKEVWEHGMIKVFTATWNMHGKPGPEDLSPLLPVGTCHVYAIGTEECERSIASSMVFTSKDRWEKQLGAALGEKYTKVSSQTLQAIHLVVYVHRGLMSVIGDVQQSFVPCGIGNTLGNKGAVGISFNIGKTALLFMNAHFAAHQTHILERNKDYDRTEKVMPLVPAGYGLEARLAAEAGLQALINEQEKLSGGLSPGSATPVDADSDDELSPVARGTPLASPALPSSAFVSPKPAPVGVPSPQSNFTSLMTEDVIPKLVSDRFDRVFFMGDFNYRISATRELVDEWLSTSSFLELKSREQLSTERASGNVFRGYVEPELAFRPTYKFDKGRDTYDSSEKRRVPAWTDRILYKTDDPEAIVPKTYKAVEELKTSDHRPVVGIFLVKLRGRVRQSVRTAGRFDSLGSPSAVTSGGTTTPKQVPQTEGSSCFAWRKSNKIAPAPME